MDDILFPSSRTPGFADGAEFEFHIRHLMLKSPDLTHQPAASRIVGRLRSFSRGYLPERGTVMN